MTILICDMEANGLHPDKIWCIVTKDVATGSYKRYVQGVNLEDFKEVVKDDVTFVGHNFLCYDLPHINRLLGTRIKVSQVVDTMVLSLLFNVNRIRIKGIRTNYGLEYWGAFFGRPKVVHDDWTTYSKEMLNRCKVDVDITHKAYDYLMREGKDWSAESIKLEQQVQYLLGLQKERGFYFDTEKANLLLVKCRQEADAIKEEIQLHFKPRAIAVRLIQPKYKLDGSLSIVGLKKLAESPLLQALNVSPLDVVGGELTLIEWHEFDLGSPKQVVARLNEAGWKPFMFNKQSPTMKLNKIPHGSPKVCEENLATLPSTAPASARLIAKYLVLDSRCKNIITWFAALGDDNRIHGTVIGCGASTHRMSHMYPNTANIPANDSLYGKECRECWTVDDPINRRLVGVDAAGIQLRVLAHYMRDPAYIEAIVNGKKEDGTDVHTVNQKAGGFATRDVAKTFIYAWLLGAGSAKIGSIIGSSAEAGRRVAEKFLQSLPALARVKNKVPTIFARGYMKRLDGGRLQLTSEHKTLACFLQAGESVIMKKAMVIAYSEMRKEKLDADFVGVIHDEFQLDCHKDCAERVGIIVAEAIKKAGECYNLACPMEGEYKIGTSWDMTH